MEIIRVVQIALIVVNIAIFAWLIYLGRKRKRQIEHCDIDEICRMVSNIEIDKKEDCILFFSKQGKKYNIAARGRDENMVKTLYTVLLHDDDIAEAIAEASHKIAEECEKFDDDEPKDNKEDKKDE